MVITYSTMKVEVGGGKIFRDDYRVHISKANKYNCITASVPPSLNPPRWTGFVPSTVYLSLLENKLFHPPLHKSSLKISCKSNVSRRKQISTT
ncbi:hypothetical protein MKX03_015936 [Papaver bracteatum]|nr:hypothetical protein MKX03_015936 [Papaver bracteatum]